MTDPVIIQATLKTGELFFAAQNVTLLANLKSGCVNCKNPLLSCLSKITQALKYQIDNNLYNGTTEELYNLLLDLIGNYIAPTTPAYLTINAGNNFSNDLSQHATFTVTGTITDGDSPCNSATIAWTRTSGPNTPTFGTLSISKTGTVTTVSCVVSGAIVGSYVFQLAAADMNAVTRTGTVTGTITQSVVALVTHFSYLATDPVSNGVNLTSGDVAALPSWMFAGTMIPGGTEIDAEFGTRAVNGNFIIIEYPDTEFDMNTWLLNTTGNSGVIPDFSFYGIFHVGSKKYIVSRTSVTVGITDPTQFKFIKQ